MGHESFRHHTFDPGALRTLCAAFDNAWKIVEPSTCPQSRDAAREAIAQAVIDMAHVGERDLQRLGSYAVARGWIVSHDTSGLTIGRMLISCLCKTKGDCQTQCSEGGDLPFSKRTLYLQVRDMLAGRIARGEWKPGFQISSEDDLAKELGVSCGTVRKALQLMEAERLILRRQGRGTFVCDPASQGLADRYLNFFGFDGGRIRDCVVRSNDVVQGVANGHERTRLRLDHSDEVYRIRRTRRHNGQNVVVEDSALPVALFPRLHERSSVGEVGALALHYGILLGRAEERLSIEAPLREIADIIGVAPGMKVMVLDRTIMTLDGWPAEWRIAYCRSDAVHYSTTMTT